MMIRTSLLAPALVASLLALGACSSIPTPHFLPGGDEPAAEATGRTVEAAIMGADNSEIGRATLAEGPKGVLITLEFRAGAIPTGWHGVHFHEHGTCADAFRASGAHVGHEEGHHGLLNPQGPEPGDLPSIYAPASGAFSAELYSPLVALSREVGSRMALLDEDGSALIIHANGDDQSSQPIGGAGARIGCASFSGGS